MSLHTPVVITDDETRAGLARARHLIVVRRDGDRLRMSGVTQTAPLPEPAMDIAAGSLTGDTAEQWRFVLDWIVKYAHRPLLVLEPGSWATELALWAQASRGWAWVVADDPGALPETALVELAGAPPAPTPADRVPGTGRMLLVRHGEATPRQLGWMAAAHEAGLLLDVASDRAVDGADRLHVVPDLGVANVAPGPGPIDATQALALTRAVRDADPTLGPAGLWQVALERWFGARDDDFDVVVLTGPPTGFFGFGAFAARHWYARVVIDHSDHAPWPDGEAGDLARDWERGWALAADSVVVADPELLAVVTPSGPDTTVEVVAADAMAPLLVGLADHTFTPPNLA